MTATEKRLLAPSNAQKNLPRHSIVSYLTSWLCRSQRIIIAMALNQIAVLNAKYQNIVLIKHFISHCDDTAMRATFR